VAQTSQNKSNNIGSISKEWKTTVASSSLITHENYQEMSPVDDQEASPRSQYRTISRNRSYHREMSPIVRNRDKRKWYESRSTSSSSGESTISESYPFMKKSKYLYTNNVPDHILKALRVSKIFKLICLRYY